MLYLSAALAHAAGAAAVALGAGDRYQVQRTTQRQPDRSVEIGWQVVLFSAGRVVGFA